MRKAMKASGEAFDLVITGGSVIDGTGKPAFPADVAVQNGVISAIGRLSDARAEKVLHAEGCVVAPGFIDSHSHSDTVFLRDTSYASKLFQGITTEVTGQCGESPFPAEPNGGDWQAESFEQFIQRFECENRTMAVNQAMLVGHRSLRASVMGYEGRSASHSEKCEMERLLRRDLASGAWGMSMGLEYVPGFFAEHEELARLAGVVKEFDGIVTAHMRNEGLMIDKAIAEIRAIGLASKARMHISHLKIDHFKAHGSAERVWKMIEDARKEGCVLTADLYPFLASCTSLSIRCPKWSKDGGIGALLSHLKGERRKEVVEGIREHYFSAERAETCLISDDAGFWPEITGKTLREIAERMLHTCDYAEAAAEILLKTEGRAGCIFFVMDQRDMLYFLSKDVGIGSDGWAFPGDPARVSGKPHPRSFATIPEFFRLARENGICSLEEAVRRVTMKPAQMLGMTDRGILKKGAAADITVFNPEEFAPESSYLMPVRLAKGVKHVVVNGRIAMENGTQTDVRSGIFLRKPEALRAGK